MIVTCVAMRLPEKISPRFGVPRDPLLVFLHVVCLMMMAISTQDENNPEGGRNSVPRQLLPFLVHLVMRVVCPFEVEWRQAKLQA